MKPQLKSKPRNQVRLYLLQDPIQGRYKALCDKCRNGDTLKHLDRWSEWEPEYAGTCAECGHKETFNERTGK